MSITSTNALSVSELTFAIKNQLESQFPKLVIQGEISNCKHHSAGHLYFDLKDAAAKIPAVMFRGSQGGLARLPKEGDQVTVKASLSVYPPHGKYQLIVREMDFLGVGELLLKLEALKKKLHGLGWFDQGKKQPLPKFPRRIGVVTSPTGAVIRDILHVLRRRYAGFQLILNPVRVQGREAPGEIAAAIDAFNQHDLADVLIVGRGGGSLEDLWAFNEEIVASAIFRSHIPIISAVGHEGDVTIADFVADIRAPTPSAAAEIVSAEKAQHLLTLKKSGEAMRTALIHLLNRYREKLMGYARHPLFTSPYTLLGNAMQRVDELKGKLDHLITKQLGERRLQLEGKAQALVALDPKRVLKRGYAILFSRKSESVIVSHQQLSPKDEVKALLSDGEAYLTVNEK
ncbi:MAG: Exodeoxyribonuclease 7 large subunit [Chlamydiae bacterium]|nr:Exodeoxyribonuclease 7 large subunit [Chlamydiota bacterium]